MFLKSARLVLLAAAIASFALSGACKKKTEDAPAATTMDASLEKGKDLYEKPEKGNCLSCHGATGHGDGPVGAAMNPKPRNLADAAGYKQGSSADAIAATIKTGVKGGPLMPPRPDLSEEDRMAIAKYVVSLQK